MINKYIIFKFYNKYIILNNNIVLINRLLFNSYVFIYSYINKLLNNQQYNN